MKIRPFEVMHLRVPPVLKKQLKEQAERLHMSLTDYVRMILQKNVEK